MERVAGTIVARTKKNLITEKIMHNNPLQFDLGLSEPPKKEEIPCEMLKIMPVSVIDISAQKKRKSENHAKSSSRANYSPFPAEISDLCFEFFLRDCIKVFDPFAGWGERGLKAKEYGKDYTGFDVSPESIKVAGERGITNILADSLTAQIPEFDGLITCPPYWNLETYGPDGIDRLKTWDDFKGNYRSIWARVYDKAAPGSTFCIMVGEWRKKHVYYDLEFVTRDIFNSLGAVIFDQVVVSRAKVSKIKIMLPQAKRLGYTVRVHESLLIFKKPLI